MVDKHAVSPIGEIERHALVCLVAARPAVLVPGLDHLPVLDEGGESLSQPIDAFAHAQATLFVEVRAVPLDIRQADAARSASRQGTALGGETHVPASGSCHLNGEPPAGERGPILLQANGRRVRAFGKEWIPRRARHP